MAFVTSRNDVGYFGFISGSSLLLFRSPFDDSTLLASDSPVVLTFQISYENPTDAAGKSTKPNQAKQSEINCAAISNCGTLIATSDCNKLLHLWKFCRSKWFLISSRTVPRKVLKVLFTNSGSDVLVVDRGGDINSFSVRNEYQCGKFVLGHVCIILDIELTDDDSYIITCDRDGKIRVSHYPQTFNIETYCLGHLEFVSAVKVFSCEETLLLSGSGDGTLRLWEYDEGKEICSYDLANDKLFLETSSKEPENSSIGDHIVAQSEVPPSNKQIEEETPSESTSFEMHDESKETLQNPSLEIKDEGSLLLVKKNTDAPKHKSLIQEDECNMSISGKGDLQQKKRLAVRCIKYCSKSKLCAVLFYTHTDVGIFSVKATQSGLTLQLIQYLQFKSIPQDAFFDAAGYLWVLLSSKDECISVFKSVEVDNKLSFVQLEDEESSGVRRICSEVRDKWKPFSAAVDVNTLYKQDFVGGFQSAKSPVKKIFFEPKWKMKKIK